MEKKNKKALLIISSFVLIGGGVGYWLWKRNKDKKVEEVTKAEESVSETTPTTTPTATSASTTPKSSGTKGGGTKVTTKPTVAPIFKRNDVVMPRFPLLNALAWEIKSDGKGGVMVGNQVGSINKGVVYGVITKNPLLMVVDADVSYGSYGAKTKSRVFVNTKDFIKA